VLSYTFIKQNFTIPNFFNYAKVDVIFNAMHGQYGEDGTVQKILDQFGIPYTGSTALASAVGMNKVLSKKVFKQNNISSPTYSYC
jgi:D-alanine-D-alanine ligase